MDISSANCTGSKAVERHQNSAFHAVFPPHSMKRSRKISFNERVRIQRISERSSEMTGAEKSLRYYTKQEMIGIQLECKQTCKDVLKRALSLSASNPPDSLEKNLGFILESDTDARGFEIQVCPMRKNNKVMIQKAVHLYHRQMKDLGSCLTHQQREIILADAYSKLSSWSQMLAVLTAQRDAAQASEQDTESACRFAAVSPDPTCTTAQKQLIPAVISPVAVEAKGGAELFANNGSRKRCKVSRAA